MIYEDGGDTRADFSCGFLLSAGEMPESQNSAVNERVTGISTKRSSPTPPSPSPQSSVSIGYYQPHELPISGRVDDL